MTRRPWSRASCGVLIETGFPSIRICPASVLYAPLSTLTRVLFPAPFSPSRTWTSPGRSWKLTWFSASTPGNSLTISRISTTKLTESGVLGMRLSWWDDLRGPEEVGLAGQMSKRRRGRRNPGIPGFRVPVGLLERGRVGLVDQDWRDQDGLRDGAALKDRDRVVDDGLAHLDVVLMDAGGLTAVQDRRDLGGRAVEAIHTDLAAQALVRDGLGHGGRAVGVGDEDGHEVRRGGDG